MSAETTCCYATRADLEPGLRAIERERPLKYVLGGLFPTSMVEAIPSALAIPNLGAG